MEGTIVKTSKYRKQQTKVGDIILSPDILKDTIQGRQLADNLIQLSYITESIADQTDEIIKRVEATSITEQEKNGIITPLNNYRDMVVTNMNLMRNSSKNILAFIDDNKMEMTEDIDKNFQDIGGFFTRYKTDNNVFTASIITLEKLVVSHDKIQQEGPSDFEIIRDKLYTVAYQNANFLQEKELKKELLKKIVAETEQIDENPNTIIYNNQLQAFRAVSNNNELTGFVDLQSSLVLCSGENSDLSSLFIETNSMENAFKQMSGSIDATTLESMAFQSMAKYSAVFIMNVNDLKSVLSQDELQAIALSPVLSLTKASADKLEIFMNEEELKSLDIFTTNAVDGLNLQVQASSADLFASKDLSAIKAINSCLSNGGLQVINSNSLDGMKLMHSSGNSLKLMSQTGLGIDIPIIF